MSTLWFIRHGPTDAFGMNGWTDVPAVLSDQAALSRLSAALPSDLPIISSDLLRARATADAIAGGRMRLPDARALREIHFGDWEGKGFAEIWARHPRLAKQLWDAPGDHHPPGGESWNKLRARVSDHVDTLLTDHPRGAIIVAHFGSILTQVQRATGETGKEVFGRKLRHLSVSRIGFAPQPSLELFDHIP